MLRAPQSAQRQGVSSISRLNAVTVKIRMIGTCRSPAPTCKFAPPVCSVSGASCLLILPGRRARCGVACGVASYGAGTRIPCAPDLELQHPASGAHVAVFGVEHADIQPHIGEWILSHRPAAVVVETACNPAHGSAAANLVSCADRVDGPAAFFQRMFCKIADAVREQGDAAFAPGGAWSEASQHLNGEQMAYVAAFATGAQLAFGDRPKHITYARLWGVPSAVELDEGYGLQAAANYRQYLRDCAAAGPQLPVAVEEEEYDPNNLHVVDRIMMLEREVVMCKVASDMCERCAATRAGDAAAPPTVALVVGSAHLPGLRSLWREGAWSELLGADSLEGSPLMRPARVDPRDMRTPGAGVKRGLLEAVLNLSVTHEVLADLDQALPALPDVEADAAAWTAEIYGSVRMQLAALPPELLAAATSDAGGLGDALAALRALRPVAGGPGWSEEVGMQLRALNFDLAPPDRQGG